MNTPNDIPIIPHNIPLYPHYTTIFVGIHHAPSLIHGYVAAFQAAERLASQEVGRTGTGCGGNRGSPKWTRGSLRNLREDNLKTKVWLLLIGFQEGFKFQDVSICFNVSSTCFPPMFWNCDGPTDCCWALTFAVTQLSQLFSAYTYFGRLKGPTVVHGF